jgi:hypothetical protein
MPISALWMTGGAPLTLIHRRAMKIDDKEVARRALRDADATTLDGGFPDFRDTWVNRVEIVDYDNIQFTKREMPYAAWRRATNEERKSEARAIEKRDSF